MKAEKRKSKILFFNFWIKIENWKLKKKCLFSISNFELKLKCGKMSFFISILIWRLHGTFGARIRGVLGHRKNLVKKQSVHRKCHSIFRLKLKWKRAFLRMSISIQNWKLKKDISFSIFNFQFLFKNWKIKSSIFVFQFSFYFEILN